MKWGGWQVPGPKLGPGEAAFHIPLGGGEFVSFCFNFEAYILFPLQHVTPLEHSFTSLCLISPPQIYSEPKVTSNSNEMHRLGEGCYQRVSGIVATWLAHLNCVWWARFTPLRPQRRNVTCSAKEGLSS